MSMNQEKVMLGILHDRVDNGKASMGYLTVGAGVKVNSQEVEDVLSRLGTQKVINGYCRIPTDLPNTDENTFKAKVKDDLLATHHDGEAEFASDIKQKIADLALLRDTSLEGKRKSTIKALFQERNSLTGQIKRVSYQNAPQMTFKVIEFDKDYADGKYEYTNGNLQVQVGDGEYVAAFWGNSNIGIKIGDGGFKAATMGDNNILVHIGNGFSSKYTYQIGKYNAFEGAQILIGQRNVSFNYGDSNDFIVMLDPSVPLPPFQSPFSGPTDIVGYLKNDLAKFRIKGGEDEVDPLTGEPLEDNYYDSQNYLWTTENAKPIINQISSLDSNSSVEYTTLFDYGKESDRNTRALQADIERGLNKGFNRMMAGGSPFKKAQTTPLKDQNFNLIISGQGADIVITNGDNQFMFGDNIPSLLDTTIASVFGMAAQEYNSENGQLSTTQSYDPRNALGQFLNQLVSRVSASLPDLTIGEALGLSYDERGKIAKTPSQRLTKEDADAIRNAFTQFATQNAQKLGIDTSNSQTGENFDITNPRHLLGLFEAFGNGNLAKFIDPSRLVDNLKSALDLGEDALKTFRENLSGKSPESNTGTTASPATDSSSQSSVPTLKSSQVFGFGGLTLPSIFDIDVPAVFKGQTDIIGNMAGLVNSFKGDIKTMQTQMFDFFSNSGYLQKDDDLLLSLGNNNFTWGGDGNDLAGLMGLNNNFWGGGGNDLYYGMGENNQGSGNEGDDTAVLLGINNLFFGGQGNDFGLAAGRYANLAGGEGDDTLYVLGSDSWLNGGDGNDYLVATGNDNAIEAGNGNDYVVSIGNYGNVDLGAGEDVLTVFGNKNIARTGDGDDYLRVFGYQSELYTGSGNDFIWTETNTRDNIIRGESGNDTFVLGGSTNTYFGGEGQDNFLISDRYQNVSIQDIETKDRLIFANVADSQVWFQREQNDLRISLDPLVGDTTGVNNSVTSKLLLVKDYFNGRQASIVVDTAAITEKGEPAHEVLTQKGLTDLISIMSKYNPIGSGKTFLTNVLESDKQALASAWNTTEFLPPSTLV